MNTRSEPVTNPSPLNPSRDDIEVLTGSKTAYRAKSNPSPLNVVTTPPDVLKNGSSTPFAQHVTRSSPTGIGSHPWWWPSPDQPDTTLTSLTLTTTRPANEKREQDSTPGQKRQTNQPGDPVGSDTHHQPNRARVRR